MHRGAPAQQEDMELAVKAFHERYASRNWTAEMEFIGSGINYNEKILSLIVGDQLPDSLYMNAESLATFASKGAFYDLNAIAAKDKSVNDYWPELVEMSRYKGKLHGLPKDYSPHVIWVNESALQSAGIPLPKAGWTWDDMLDIARRFTQRSPTGELTKLGVYALSWYVMLWQGGGELFDKAVSRSLLGEPAAVEALQWIGDLYTKHRVTGTANALKELGCETVQQAFQRGQVALWWMGRWAVSQLRAMAGVQWDAYPLPKGKVEANVYKQSGPTVCHSTKHAEVAWEWCKVWTGPAGQTLNIDSGDSVPTLTDKAVRERFLSKTPPSQKGNQVFYDAIKIGRVEPQTDTIGWADWGAVWNTELNKIWSGDLTAKAATELIVPKVNQFIADKARG
jgi:multiple sugar transport system substrate-binding protein